MVVGHDAGVLTLSALDLGPLPTPLPRHYAVAGLLLLLAESPAHGYDLVTRLEPLGLPAADLSSHYRMLRAMERDGLIASHWEQSATGPDRRLYRLTPAGVSDLHDWGRILGSGHQLLGHYLDRYEDLIGHRAADGAA